MLKPLAKTSIIIFFNLIYLDIFKQGPQQLESSIFSIISHYQPYLPGILLSHQQALAFLYLPYQDHGDGHSQLLQESVGKSALFLILC